MNSAINKKDRFFGRYNVYDGTYFYDSYYLLNKYDQKLIEFSADEYFENNQLVKLDTFIKELHASGFGEASLYKRDTFYNKKEERFSIDWYLFLKEEQIIININHDTIKNLNEVCFKPHKVLAVETIDLEDLIKIFKIAESCIVETEDDNKRYINIVSSLPREGLRLNKYEIKKPLISDLNLYYGDGFEQKHKRFVDLVHQKDRSGLFIFHGITGSGKTNYIRHLIAHTKNDIDYIFYPITLLRELANPELITFISDYQHSVLIIEESEDSVQARDNFNTDKTSIANLLNITDGLLSDVLNLKIISTFNTDIKNLDKALLREGRLLGIHKFEKVEPDKANRIAQLNGINKSFSEAVTLAQIFNNPLREDLSDFISSVNKIGF